MSAVCPPGFDCAFANSCPSMYVDCPTGFFCGSYAGLQGQSDMDYSYAIFKTQFGGSDEDITRKNAKHFIDPERAIQNACLTGFYCPDATSMEICPEGHWCPERTVVPQKCDPLSICPNQSQFQVNFINPVLMLAIIVSAIACSIYLTWSQKRRDSASHKKDPAARVASPVNEDGPAVSHHVNSDDKDGMFELSFQNVHCKIPGTNQVILPEISGTIPAGKISALMGPTASGKSTLTKVLRHGHLPISSNGSVKYSIRSSVDSSITLTAREAQPYIGHVPQEDILDRQLTIRELFTFHAKARSRYNRIRSEDEIRRTVDEVLADLAIQHVADSIIGGGENMAANISGGQLKRVNIGCELVALSRPALLLLDEPTAGLDAAIAFELMQTLESLKKRGITIFMVIQQPRPEIFERIDHLMLMNTMGGIAYEGPSAEAMPYLLHLGYSPNAEAFDADYCLDVLNGVRDTSTYSSRKLEFDSGAPGTDGIVFDSARLDCTKLHLIWKCRQQSVTLDEESSQPLSTSSVSLTTNQNKFNNETHIPKESTAESLQEYWKMILYHSYLNAERLVVIRLRNRTSLLVYIFIDVIMALALSVGFTIYLQDTYRGVFAPPVDEILQAFFPSALSGKSSNNASSMGFAQLLFFISSALGSSSALSAVPVFSGQVDIASRENSAGISVVSFGIGRILGDVFFVLLHGIVFAGIWMLFGHAGHFYDWLAVILSTAFAASGIGYIASASYNQSTASTWAIVAAFVSSVFAGVEPSLTQVSKYPVVSWPWYCNYATWTAEATYYTWTRYLLDEGHVSVPLQDGADMYGYEIDGLNGIARSVGAMIALGVGMRAIAAFMMYRRVVTTK